VPAPVRFLPEYDNVLLSHDERGRFAAESGAFGWDGAAGIGAVLHDGVVRASWRVDRRPAGSGGLLVDADADARLPRRAEVAIAAGGRRLLRCLATDGPGGADPDGEVRVVRRTG
jgi:hypothetical protein